MILKKNGPQLLKCYLKGKISRKLANGQNIDYSEKRKWPKLRLNTIIFKYVYWYMKRVYRTIGPLVLFSLHPPGRKIWLLSSVRGMPQGIRKL